MPGPSSTRTKFKRIVGSSGTEMGIVSDDQHRIQFGSATLANQGADTVALLHGLGTSGTPVVTDSGNVNFMGYWVQSNATSGDVRGMYTRLFLTGTGGTGEAARIYTTMKDATGSTARGAHITLDFGSTGKVTGLGAALECTLHIPNQGTQSGTLTALQLSINSDGSSSDPSGSTLSYIRTSNQGDTTGDDDVNTDVSLFNIIGHAAGAGTLFQATTTGYILSEITNSLKISVGGTTLHLLCSTLGAQAT